MALSEQELNIAQQIKEQGGTEQDFIEILQQIRSKQPTPSTDTPVIEPVKKSTGIIPTQTEPVEDKSFLQKAGESLKEQVTTGLIGKGIKSAESAYESGHKPGLGNQFIGMGQVLESGLQIAGGAVGEVYNQGLNVAGSILKGGLETLNTENLASLKAMADAPIEVLKKPAIQKLGSLISQGMNKIPENLRDDAKAFLNLIPAGKATKGVALTEKGALNLGEKFTGQAEKLASEIIKPGKYDEFATKALVENISKAKTYKQLQTNLESSLKKTGKALTTELNKSTGLFKDTRLKGALDFVINDLKSNEVLAKMPERANKIKELQALSNQLGPKGKGVKLIDVQRIKGEIDDSFNLYSKSGDVKAGDVAKALEPERKYVKQFIEKQAPNVKDLNTNYEGLREATALAKDKARQFGNDATPDPTFFGRIRNSIPGIKKFETERPSTLKIEASQLGKKTSQIEALKKSAGKIKSVQEILKIPSVDLSNKLSPVNNIFKKK